LNPSAEALLAANALPISDLQGNSIVALFGYVADNQLRGIVGLEMYGPAALLRSLAVQDTGRGVGLGAALVAHAEQFAAQQGVGTLYLLTTTATDFFERRGYSHVARDAAPASIAATSQFSDLCPSSSAFMAKSVGS
ncbi:arsenic resistance N-acetyltransferase ArsN2, partial [Luteimonas lutimaris]|uniref:arsenic resistance N-acetyltransferase ArsN2 n=1 Tax=Luteimonas lutimaris TaxID=698645 RepID=UPI0031DD7BBD